MFLKDVESRVEWYLGEQCLTWSDAAERAVYEFLLKIKNPT